MAWPVPVIKHTPTQATVTHIEVEGDEVLSLDAGIVLFVDPDELPFIAQPSLITLASNETQPAVQSSVYVQG